MDVRQIPITPPTELPRRALIRRAYRDLCLVLALLLSVACTTNSKPSSLPPQTMAPKPPELEEPVSNAPQEMEPDQLPTSTGEPVIVEPTPETTEAKDELNPIMLVIESGGESEESAETDIVRGLTGGEDTAR